MSYDLCLHVDANDPALLAFAFVNALNYMNGLPGKEFELVLVANGPAVKLFVPAQAELQKTAEELMARGLKLRLCKNALDANKMTAGRPLARLRSGARRPGGDRGAAEQGLRLHPAVTPPFLPAARPLLQAAHHPDQTVPLPAGHGHVRPAVLQRPGQQGSCLSLPGLCA